MEIWATEGAEGPPHLPWSVEGAEGQGLPYLVPERARTGLQGSGSGGAGWLSAWHRLDREVVTPWRIQCRYKMWQTRSRYRKARTIDERFPGLVTCLHCQVRPGPSQRTNCTVISAPSGCSGGLPTLNGALPARRGSGVQLCLLGVGTLPLRRVGGGT